MKFYGVRDLRTKSSEIWKELKEAEELIITSNGKPFAILASVSEKDWESKLAAFRKARTIEAVTSLQQKSVEVGTDKLTQEEVSAEIDRVRKKLRT